MLTYPERTLDIQNRCQLQKKNRSKNAGRNRHDKIKYYFERLPNRIPSNSILYIFSTRPAERMPEFVKLRKKFK